MAKFCGACGQQLSDASAFCIHCGTPTQAASAPVRPPVPPPAPTPPAPSLHDAPTQPYAQVNVPPPVEPAYTPVSTPPQAQYTPVITPPPAQYAAVSTPPPAQYAPVNTPPPGQQYAPVNPPVNSPGGGPPAGAPPQYPPAPAAKSGSGLKIVIGILAFLFIGGLLVMGGLFYVGHRVVNKIKTAAAENGLSTTPSDTTTAAVAPFHGDACALLSKDDVGASIGVLIVATHATGGGCEYLANGSASDMTARHLSATMAAKGATSEQQDTAHQLASSILGAAEQNKPKDQTEDASGTTPVFVFSIDTNSAREQMKLNTKVLGALGSVSGSGSLSGIGDEAFDSAGAIMMVRKGDKLIRIMYMTCPCTTDQIKPLARKLADAV